MTALEQAISSGQVSAGQIEAHRAAGELPIVMFEPRFQSTYCSQCGTDCGPGDEGVSRCADHSAHKPLTLRQIVDSAGSDDAHVLCRAGDVRAALLDADKWRSIVQIGVTETQSLRERKNGSILWFGPSVESAPNGTAIYAAIKGAQS